MSDERAEFESWFVTTYGPRPTGDQHILRDEARIAQRHADKIEAWEMRHAAALTAWHERHHRAEGKS